MHSFDLDKLSGKRIIVRRAAQGEKITTLDEVKRELDTSMLAMCDAEKPVAVAGVMGGIDSGITGGTTNVLLEVAYFDRASVWAASRKLNLTTEASYRFERGVDIENLKRASDRAVQLICELAAGEKGEFIDNYPTPIERLPVTSANISAAVGRFTGLDVEAAECDRILSRLGIQQLNFGEYLTPSWRHDIAIEEDMVEEVARHAGYGIGEIRELRDGIAYAPQGNRFKLYIIDEVHMLTTEAFNALLKTLEEPPAHVKFIFATTEPHKIPVTILSRCQRFDFKRIALPVMAGRLQEILQAEGVQMDPAGLRLVARESEGSMRDALSLLDRVISFAGMTASYEAVASVLGVADRAWLQKLVTAALDKVIPSALVVVAEAFDYGRDLKKFASDLVHHLRDAAILQVAGEGAPTDLSKEERDSFVELGKRLPPRTCSAS